MTPCEVLYALFCNEITPDEAEALVANGYRDSLKPAPTLTPDQATAMFSVMDAMRQRQFGVGAQVMGRSALDAHPAYDPARQQFYGYPVQELLSASCPTPDLLARLSQQQAEQARMECLRQEAMQAQAQAYRRSAAANMQSARTADFFARMT